MSAWIHAAVLLGSLLAASLAEAQVQGGDVRLFIDTDVLSFERKTAQRGDELEIARRIDFGPGSSGLSASLPGYVSLGAGYAFAPHLVASVRGSFVMHQGYSERYFDSAVQPALVDPRTTAYLVRLELEVPFNPKRRVVLGAMAGFDFRSFSVVDDDGYDASTTAFGPAAGLVSHFFLAKDASLDLSVVGVLDFLSASGDDPRADADSYFNVAVSALLGLSLWP